MYHVIVFPDEFNGLPLFLSTVAIYSPPNSQKLIEGYLETPALSNIPQHLDFDKKKLTAKVLGVIDREWVALKLNELFVIEYYSRKI